jgi:Leucine-rich repeat (LRR) protein
MKITAPMIAAGSPAADTRALLVAKFPGHGATEVDDLSVFPNLQTVNFSGNALTGLGFVSANLDLKNANFADNRIEKLDLAGGKLRNLTVLNVGKNLITAIEDMGTIKSLQALS